MPTSLMFGKTFLELTLSEIVRVSVQKTGSFTCPAK